MVSEPMLDRYIGECMVSIININMVPKNLPVGIKTALPVKYYYLVSRRIFKYPSYYLGQYHPKPY